MKSAEEIGLYDGEQPDATVDGISPDPSDPSFAEVRFSDGRVATMPTSHAEAMPQTPQPFSAVPPQEYGPPVQQPAPFADPSAVTEAPAPGAGAPPGPTMEEQLLADPMTGMPVGNAAPTDAAAGGMVLEPPGGVSALPGAQVDPGAAVVDQGHPGGFGDFSRSNDTSVTNTDTVEDPAVLGARTDDAYDSAAYGAREADLGKYRAGVEGINTELDAREAQEAQLRAAVRQRELETAEHARITEAMEKTPIDEDGFWSEKPGRQAAAWVALALSGFLQGATRGANPALNQMTQALNHAQDRWLENQQKSKAGLLATRSRMMDSQQNALSSLRLQISGVVEKKIQLEAQREGLPPPPALSTYLAQQGVKRAEEKNAIGSRVAQTATTRLAEEQRATPATGPTFRGDQELAQLGVDKKAHADAMNPSKLNLGGVVGGATRLQDISKALDAIAAKNGGELPAQGTASWSSLGLAPLAARLGIKNAEEQVNTRQLLEEAKLAFKQTVNIKSIDSENEGKNFNKIMDSGEGQTTIAAVRQKAQQANESAIGIASGVSRNPQGYIDFVRRAQTSNRGVTPDSAPRFRPMGPPGAAPRPDAEASAVGATTGGGPATPPLPTATATGLSRTGTYQRGSWKKPH